MKWHASDKCTLQQLFINVGLVHQYITGLKLNSINHKNNIPAKQKLKLLPEYQLPESIKTAVLLPKTKMNVFINY